MIGSIKRFLRAWNELLLLPVAILVWVWSAPFLRWLDPTAAVFDAGILQKFVYAVIGTLICHFTTWLMLKLTFPNIFLYIYRRFEFELLEQEENLKAHSITSEKKWARLRYSFLFFALYLVTFLVVLATV